MSQSPITVNVAGVDYNLIKTGRAQAEQVLQLTRWIYTHGKKASKAFDVSSTGFDDAPSGIAFLGELISNLDADAVIDLFTLVIGCPKEVSETHFDVSILVDSVILVYENQPALKRLLERFFSGGNSKDSTEDNSTISE